MDDDRQAVLERELIVLNEDIRHVCGRCRQAKQQGNDGTTEHDVHFRDLFGYGFKREYSLLLPSCPYTAT